MGVRNLQFVLSGSDKSASKSLDRVGKKADGLGSKLRGVGKAAAFGIAGGAAIGGAALVAMAMDGVRGASDLAESQSKVNTVFGQSAKAVSAFADTAARDLGMTKQAALEATGTFGNLFSALGIGVKPAADMSKQLVTLATDLGSFNNVSSEEALLALRSGLLGEAEPLRKFGVSLSAARIEAEALSLGLVKSVKDAPKIRAAQNAMEAATKKVAAAQKQFGKNSLQVRQAVDARVRAEGALTKAMQGQKTELTAAQKAQAAYAVIMKDTKVAQGDFARTSGGLANQQKILSAQFSEVKTKIGEQLLPMFVEVATFLNDKAVPAFDKFVEQFKKGEGPGGKLRDVLSGMRDVAVDLWPAVKALAEHTASFVGFLADHPTAVATVATSVAAYAVAMKAAAAATATMAAIKWAGLALGMGSVGTAATTAAPGIATFGASAGTSAGKVGRLTKALGGLAKKAGLIGIIYAASEAIESQIPRDPKVKRTTLPDGTVVVSDIESGRIENIPSSSAGPPKPGTKTKRANEHGNRPRAGGNLTITHNVDGRSLATATSRAQVGMRSRGYLPAMP